MAFAALGAAEVLTVAPDDPAARALLAAAVRAIGRPTGSRAWPWPEARLTYANAALPEVLLAAGEHLGDERALDDGLQLLGWLVDVETSGRPPVRDPGRRLVARESTVPPSISSRSRWPHWPTRAPARSD